jgi:hypothetical protein
MNPNPCGPVRLPPRGKGGQVSSCRPIDFLNFGTMPKNRKNFKVSVQNRTGTDETPGSTVRTNPAGRLIGNASVIASLLGGAGFEPATSAGCVSAIRRKIAPLKHSPSQRYACPAESGCAVHRAQTARPQVPIAVAARIPKRVRYSVTGAGFRDNPTDTTLRDSNGRLPQWGDIWRLELLGATSRRGRPLLAENARAVLRGFPSISQEGRHEARRTTGSR